MTTKSKKQRAPRNRTITKVKYTATSKCIKVMTTVRLDVLPVVRQKGHYDVQYEPVIMYHPDYESWKETYARYHQKFCSKKNAIAGRNR